MPQHPCFTRDPTQANWFFVLVNVFYGLKTNPWLGLG